MQEYIVYILRSEKTNKYYIGHTNNLEDRLARHNSGMNKYTKNKGPWFVVHLERFASRAQAMQREKEIKCYKGGMQFKNLLLS